jgi:hypothetical protein
VAVGRCQPINQLAGNTAVLWLVESGNPSGKGRKPPVPSPRTVRALHNQAVAPAVELNRRFVEVVRRHGRAEVTADVEAVVRGEDRRGADRHPALGDDLPFTFIGTSSGEPGLGAKGFVSTSIFTFPTGSFSFALIFVRSIMNRLYS